MKKTYFNHDSNSFTDIKIIKMRSKLGIESYGIFWALLELLFAEENISFPDYYDIHYAKRIEQDINKTKQYHKHLRGLGYTQQRNNYNGETKWIKK